MPLQEALVLAAGATHGTIASCAPKDEEKLHLACASGGTTGLTAAVALHSKEQHHRLYSTPPTGNFHLLSEQTKTAE